MGSGLVVESRGLLGHSPAQRQALKPCIATFGRKWHPRATAAGASRGAQDACIGRYAASSRKIVCQASSTPVPYNNNSPRSPEVFSAAGNGVFVLMLLCVLVFIADNLLHLPGMSLLHLNHYKPQWWQWGTHLFCHANFAHLSGNLFNLCVFGKMVEETEGAVGVSLAFLVCGIGAAIAAFFLTPALAHGRITVSVGASGAIFGLFAVSVATRLRWNLKQLLEAAVLGQFVVRQVLEEAKNQATGGLVLGGLAVSHVAHLAGAAVGVALVLALSKLPPA
ncbi:hypothetical protein CHLRE_16g664801v5 [Chlamydomonas reinhardtii]|uniref:Peptidase S54 rhomboid domain-containing protein n=1 Tax=Chlamydomonas reinhardtii TaxID=3055 RepID=A0A2K3CTT7_CHLRE|nr:uncharacterized protein CHLRE_16g664801v5 [Chlamydomonas reinhardtii]PNW71689.1 hypothetical protein CHLRE_16g664801v5 [Chlamydomonas reinhardtii]